MLVTDRACDGDFFFTWLEGLGVILVNDDCVFWHYDPRKHMTRRDTVVHNDVTGKLVPLSKTNNVTIKISKYCADGFFCQHKPPHFRTQHCFLSISPH